MSVALDFSSSVPFTELGINLINRKGLSVNQTPPECNSLVDACQHLKISTNSQNMIKVLTILSQLK